MKLGFVFLLAILVLCGPAKASSMDNEGMAKVVTGTPVVVQEGEVLDDLTVVATSAEIYGEVGDLTVVGGSLFLGPRAVIRGKVQIIGSHVEITPGARWEGEWVEVGGPFDPQTWQHFYHRFETFSPDEINFKRWGLTLLALFKVFFLIGFSLVALYVAPYFCEKSFTRLNGSLFKSSIWGVFSALLVIPITVFLTLSIIGLPLLPLQYSLLFLFFLVGHFLVGALIVHWLQGLTGRDWLKGMWSKSIVGVILLEVLLWIPILGAPIYWILVLAGFGAVSSVFYGQILKPNKVSLP